MGDFFMRNICLIGGDKRNLELAKLLIKDNENCIKTFANEKMQIDNIEKYSSLENAIKESEIIITGVPVSKDGKYLVGKYTNLEIELKKFLPKLKNVLLVTGNVPEEFEKNLQKNNNDILDLLKDESYTMANAKFTVEGIIKYLIENTEDTIFNNNILVIGYGRIGKILCNVLKNFTENIFCITNKDEEIEVIKANAINTITYENFEKNLSKFKIIVNTVPHLVLDDKKLAMLNKEVFILDVASKPGGIDCKFAQKNNINYLWKLGIPGEISPLACAKNIEKIIYKKILQ